MKNGKLLYSLFTLIIFTSSCESLQYLPMPEENIEPEFFPQISFEENDGVECSEVSRQIISEAFSHGSKAVRSLAFESCLIQRIARDYVPCAEDNNPALQNPEYPHSSEHALAIASKLSEFINDVDRNVRFFCFEPEQSPGAFGYTKGVDIRDFEYSGDFRVGILQAHDDVLFSYANVSQVTHTLWHEMAHNIGYMHPPNNCQDSIEAMQSNGLEYNRNIHSAPYIVELCMREATYANRIYLWDYMAGNPDHDPEGAFLGVGEYAVEQGSRFVGEEFFGVQYDWNHAIHHGRMMQLRFYSNQSPTRGGNGITNANNVEHQWLPSNGVNLLGHGIRHIYPEGTLFIENSVILYSDENFMGESVRLKAGTFYPGRIPLLSLGETIRSIRVPAGLSIRINFLVQEQVQSISMVPESYENHMPLQLEDIGSITVNPVVTLFSERDFFGSHTSVAEGLYSLEEGTLPLSGQISSLIAYPQYRIIACSHEQACFELSSSYPQLPAELFDGIATLQIIQQRDFE